MKNSSSTDPKKTDTNQNDKNERYVLTSVDTSLRILDLFIDHAELGAADIASLLHINRSKAFRFLVTLEHSGYITKNDNSRYRLSAKVSILGQLAQNRMELINLVHPWLVDISEKCGESSHLTVMNNATESIFIDKSVGSLWLKMDVMIGYTSYAHNSASGKAILAFSTDQFVNQYLRLADFRPRTDYSIHNAKELLTELEQIRRDGYATDAEQAEYGLTCFAVPILSNDSPIAAISISGPTTRQVKRKDQLLELLHTAQAGIQNALGNSR